MSTLIIILPSTLPAATTACGMVLTEDGHTVKRYTETPLALLADTSGAEIVAMVPATQLSWHRLMLPKGTLGRGFFQDANATRLRSVLDGLLEDRLLDDPAQLHFAIAPQAREDESVWVVVCDRAWLAAWLLALEQSGCPVARIVPEVEPSATQAQHSTVLHILGSADQALLLCSNPQGVTTLPLSGTVVALVSGCDTASGSPKVIAEPGASTLAEQYFEGSVDLQTAPLRALAAARSAWDLAQFDLSRTRRTRTRKHLSSLIATLLHAPQWQPARWATVALILVNLAGLQAWTWREHAALAAKKVALRDILTTTFPDVRVVVDAPLQMARSLADLQRQSGAAASGDMETLLGLFQTIAPEIPTPSTIEFIAGELRFKGLDSAAVSLDSLASRLHTHGYTAVLEGDSIVLKQERRP